ncbi:MAG: recombinase family protein [Oscillospiraceae bacterium]|nr:recombinase family protein [Oscillospiraceae bacterium]
MPKDQALSRTVACYCRVSTENQIENYSIDEQRERLEAFCKAKGWSKPVMFIDPGFSGGTLERPALRSLLGDVEHGRFGTVVVYKLDRLSRSQKDTLYLIEDVFNRHGVNFVSVCENFDTGTPFGKAMIGILSVFAQLEKDQITERFTMGRIGRAKSGLFHGGGNAPTGYDYVGGHLVVNEFGAMQVREVYERFKSGESVHSIQRSMHEKYGGWTNHTLVYNVLRNSIYVGMVKFNGIEYNGEHTPIINEELFCEVQTLLSSRSAADGRKTPFRAGFLLSGLVYCGSCGARYHANHGYYKCYSRAKSDKKYIIDPDCKNPNLKIGEFDKFIIGEISKASLDPFALLGNIAENPEDNRRTVTEKKLTEIKASSDRLIDLYQAAEIPLESVTGRLRELEAERALLEKQLDELPRNRVDKRSEWTENIARYGEFLGSSEVAAGRMYVSSVIRKITVRTSGEIKIEWRV